MPCQETRKRAYAVRSAGSTSFRSAASEARRRRLSTSGSHHSRSVPPGRSSPRTSRSSRSSSRSTRLDVTIEPRRRLGARERPARPRPAIDELPQARRRLRHARGTHRANLMAASRRGHPGTGPRPRPRSAARRRRRARARRGARGAAARRATGQIDPIADLLYVKVRSANHLQCEASPRNWRSTSSTASRSSRSRSSSWPSSSRRRSRSRERACARRSAGGVSSSYM